MSILEKEISVRAPLDDVWHAWTTDERTQVVVLFDEDGDGLVHVRLYEHGWQEGEHWQRGWDYFDRAWGLVLNAMKQHLESV